VLQSAAINATFTCSFVEIYDDKVMDLLTGKAAHVRRDTGEVNGAVEAAMDTPEQMRDIILTGHSRKRFAATALNDRSSRSHTAFIIHVLQSIQDSSLGNERPTLKSQLFLIDLAGSERIKKSMVTGNRMKEAVQINSSLLVLGKVISALGQGSHHIPYLESKLTTLLKGAFRGNSRTVAIINCRSEDDYGDETLQSMRFAERCALVTYSMRRAASSVESALSAIDLALASTAHQLSSLEKEGKSSMKAYANLKTAYKNLAARREQLIGQHEI
jgi:hypothetical protein